MKSLNLSRISFCLVVFIFLFNIFVGTATAQIGNTFPEKLKKADDLHKKGDLGGAMEVLDKYLEIFPTDTYALYKIGLFWKSNQLEGLARGYFERLIVLQPENADVMANLAYFRWLSNEKKFAAEIAERALQKGVEDAELHHVLAEYYLENKDYENALKQSDVAIKLNPNHNFAYLSKYFALLGLNRKEDAAQNLEQFLKLSPNNSIWTQELDFIRKEIKNAVESTAKPTSQAAPEQIKGAATEKAHDANGQISTSSPLRILTQPRPGYTERARAAGLQGTLRLRLTFSSDKTIKSIRPLSHLPFGLTEKAINAASNIVFEPAFKNGVPVSTSRIIEYRFTMF